MSAEVFSWIKRNYIWLAPIFAMIILTPFTPWLDLHLTSWVFQQGGNAFYSNTFVRVIFDYGPRIAQATFLLGLTVFILSFFIRSLRDHRQQGLYLALCLVVGSGLIVNVILKDHWGRPRPRQVEQFGGKQEFRPYYRPNFFHQPETSKSFPCGHCSMGFYFFSLMLLGKQMRKRWVFWLGCILTIVMGSLLSIARIMQGGHFLSDVLMSALIMWFVALLFLKVLKDSS